MNAAAPNTDWLAQLAPEHPPATPGWWPPAPGWWALAVLLVGVAVAAIWWWRQPERRLRRAGLRELRRLRARDADPEAAARGVQRLLRRYALAAFGADQVARLSGEAWLQFVAAHGAPALGGPLGRSLLAASFSGRHTSAQLAEREAWYAAAELFLRQARRKAAPGALP